MSTPQAKKSSTASRYLLAPTVLALGASCALGSAHAQNQTEITPVKATASATATATPTKEPEVPTPSASPSASTSPSPTPSSTPTPESSETKPPAPVFKADKFTLYIDKEETLTLAGYKPSEEVSFRMEDAKGQPVNLGTTDKEVLKLNAQADKSGEVRFTFTLHSIEPGQYWAKATSKDAEAKAEVEVKAADSSPSPTPTPEPTPEPTQPVEPEPTPKPSEPVEPEPTPEPTQPVEPTPIPSEPVPAPEPTPAPTAPEEPKPEPTMPVDPKPAEPVKPEPAPEPSTPIEPQPDPAPVQPKPEEPPVVAPSPAEPVEPSIPEEDHQVVVALNPTPPREVQPRSIEMSGPEPRREPAARQEQKEPSDLAASLPQNITDSRESWLALDSFTAPQRTEAAETQTITPREFTGNLQAAPTPQRIEATTAPEESREFSGASATATSTAEEDSEQTPAGNRENSSTGPWIIVLSLATLAIAGAIGVLMWRRWKK